MFPITSKLHVCILDQCNTFSLTWKQIKPHFQDTLSANCLTSNHFQFWFAFFLSNLSINHILLVSFVETCRFLAPILVLLLKLVDIIHLSKLLAILTNCLFISGHALWLYADGQGFTSVPWLVVCIVLVILLPSYFLFCHWQAISNIQQAHGMNGSNCHYPPRSRTQWGRHCWLIIIIARHWWRGTNNGKQRYSSWWVKWLNARLWLSIHGMCCPESHDNWMLTRLMLYSGKFLN